ncbi:MAG: hypothetical protein WA892_06975 [Ornithinimicrobium sp.]
MEDLYQVVVLAHVLGLAALIGGYFALVWATPRSANPAFVPSVVMVWGARAQVLTGLILVGLGEAVVDKDYDHVKIAVKLVVALLVAALVEATRGRGRRGQSFPAAVVHLAGALAILNATVAVLWT